MKASCIAGCGIYLVDLKFWQCGNVESDAWGLKHRKG